MKTDNRTNENRQAIYRMIKNCLVTFDYISFNPSIQSLIIDRLVLRISLRTLAQLFKSMSRMCLITGPEALETVIELRAIHAMPPESIDGLDSSNQKHCFKKEPGSMKGVNSLSVYNHHIELPSDNPRFSTSSLGVTLC